MSHSSQENGAIPSLAQIFFGRLANFWRKRRTERAFTRRRLQFQAIEPRILLSADLVFNAPANLAADDFTLRLDSNNGDLELLNGTTVVASQALAETTGVIISGEDGWDDSLTVDFAYGGFFSLDGGITFNGGTDGFDGLSVVGGAFTTVTHTVTTTGPGLSGSIVYEDDLNPPLTIDYTGLEPVDMTGSTVDNLVFNLPGTNDLAILEDDGTAGNGVSQIRSQNASQTFDVTTFTNPNVSLTVNMGGDSGSFTVALLPDFTAALTINGDAGSDSVTLTSPLTLGALSITAESIAINGGSVTTSGGQTYTGAVSIARPTTLTASEIDFNGGLNSVTGAGFALTLLPATTAAPIVIGGLGDSGPAALDITDGDIAALANGFTSISIGYLGGVHAITVESSNFKDAVALFADGSGGTITVTGTLSTATAPVPDAGAVDFFGSGSGTTLSPSVGAAIVTHGGAITIRDTVILGTPSSVTLDTTNNGAASGRSIVVTGTINDDVIATTALVLRAGTAGIVSLQESVGITPILGLTVLSANVVRLPAVQTGVGGVSVATAGSGPFIVLGGNINTALGTPNAGSVLINGPVRLSTDVDITTDHATGTDGNITFQAGSTIVEDFTDPSPRTLTIFAGGGDVSFGGAVGLLQGLNISSANDVTLLAVSTRNGGLSVATTTAAGDANSITLNGIINTTLGAGGAGNVTLVGPVALNASINAGSGAITASESVTFSGVRTVNAATFSAGSLVIGAGASAALNAATTTATLSLSGTSTVAGTLTGAGTVTVTGPGSSTWAGGGVYTGTGRLVVQSGHTLTISGSNEKDFGTGTLVNEGTVLWTEGNIEVIGSGTVVNRGLFDVQGGGTFGDQNVGVGTLTFNNEVGATLRKSGLGLTAIGSSGGNTPNGVNFNNAGAVEVQTGELSINHRFPITSILPVGTGTSSGTFSVAAGAALRFGGNNTLIAGSAVSGSGAVSMEHGSFSTVGTWSHTGTLAVHGGTAAFTPIGAMAPSTLTVTQAPSGPTTSATFNRQVTVTTGPLEVSGGTAAFNAATTATSLELSGTGTLTGAGIVTLAGPGDSTWTPGGTYTGSGQLVVTADHTLTLSGTLPSTFKRFGTGTLVNDGTVVWAEGNIDVVGSGTVVNRGLFDIQADGDSFGDNGTGLGTLTLNNELGGTLRKSSPLLTAIGSLGVPGGTQNGVNLNNTGLVEVLSGTLSINHGFNGAPAPAGSLANSGSIFVAAGATLQRTGGFTNAGVLEGNGTFDVGPANVLTNVLTNTGTVAPGVAGGDTTGTLSISGNYRQETTGKLEIELAGLGGGNFDVLAVSGAATIVGDAALHADLINGFLPLNGDRFQFMTFTARSGDFVNTLLPAESFIDTHTTDLELVYLNAAPSIAIDKTVDANEDGAFASTESVLEGGAGDQLVDYRFVITNTSPAITDPVTLTVTGLTDDRLGDLTAAFLAANGGSATIAVGQSVTFFVDDFLVPVANAGSSHVNTASVVAFDDEGTETQGSDFATVTYADAAPTVTIDKTVDSNEDGVFASSESVPEGGSAHLVDYRFVVANASAASTDPLTVTGLTDDRLGDLTAAFLAANGGAATLAVGQSVTFFVLDAAVPPGNAGDSHVNTVTASAFDDEGTEASDSDTATVSYANVAPAIVIDKSVDADGDGLFADAESVLEGGAGDQLVDYRFFLTNASAASTDPLTVTGLTDDRLGDLLAAFLAANGGAATLAVGQSVTFFVLDAAVPPGNAGDSHVNTVTASAFDDEGTEASDSDTATVSYANVAPAIVIDKSVDADGDGLFADAESVLEGGAGDQLVDYRFFLTNASAASTDPLTVTELADDKLGNLLAAFLAANNGSATLAVGQSVTFFVDDFLVPVANAGSSHVNTASVVAFDDEGTETQGSDFATVTYADAAPTVTIDKTVDSNEDGVFASSESVPEGGSGHLVDYRFVVANASSASTDPLTVTGLTDDRLGDLTAAFLAANNGSATLAVGQSVTFFVDDFLVPVANAGSSHVNTASVVAFDDEGTETQGSDFATVAYADAAPTVTMDKTVDANEDGLFASTESVLEGGAGNQEADYRFVVANASAASTDPLTLVSLTDDKLGDLMAAFLAANNGSATLGVGQSVTFFVFDVPLPVANAGASHVNTVTVSALDDEGSQAESTDFATVTYADVTPTVVIDKSVDANGDGAFSSTESVLEGGAGNQEADYRFVVSNTSTASTDPLTVTALSDDKLGDLMAAFLAANGGSATIAVGQSVTFFVDDFLVPVANAGSSHVNTVSVVAFDDEGTETQGADFATVTYADLAPTVVIDKSVDANGDGVFASSETLPAGGSGGQVDYRFVVSNTSAASTDPLTLVSLTDDKLGDLIPAFLAANGGSNVIAVGASVSFFVLDALVPPGNAGQSHVNIATATAADDEGGETQSTDFATVTYANNAPALSISDVTVVEGDSGVTNAIFSVSLSNPFSQAVSVEYSTADGTASASSDYNAGSGLVTFAPGETLRTITVAVNGDLAYEFDEMFLVDLANPLNGTLGDSQGIGTIVNDDAAPTLVISDVTVLEGDTGSTDAVFTVSLIGATEVTAIVNFSTADGTASAGSDYTATSGTLIFNPGDSTRTITVTVNGDLSDESDETFFVNLADATNAVIGDGQGAGTIVDDDAAAGGIDLVGAVEWDPDDLLIPGDHEHVTVVVSNVGDTAVHQQVKVKLYASADQVFDGSDIFLDQRLTGCDIEPGGSSTAQFNLVLPSKLLPGEYFLLAVVDPANQVAESNELNNTAVGESFDFHWMFGQVPDHGWETLTVRDGDGTWVNFSLFGPGTGEITIDERGEWDLLVTGTTGSSVLSILTLGGGDHRVELDDIHVTGALRGILAPKMDLTGTLAIDGALGAGLMIGSATEAVIAVQTILGSCLLGLGVQGIAILGDLEDSEILVGADLGADGQLGGSGADADTYSAGDLGDLLITGSMISSCVRVGQDPVDGIFDNGNDVLLGGSIDSITIRGEMSDDSCFVASDLPWYARIDGEKVYTATDPRFWETPPSDEGTGSAECGIDWSANAGCGWGGGYSPFGSSVGQSNFSDFLVRLFR